MLKIRGLVEGRPVYGVTPEMIERFRSMPPERRERLMRNMPPEIRQQLNP